LAEACWLFQHQYYIEGAQNKFEVLDIGLGTLNLLGIEKDFYHGLQLRAVAEFWRKIGAMNDLVE
jgi:hypothetical protein